MTRVTRLSGNRIEENIYRELSEISVTICHLSPDMPCSSTCQKLVAVGWRLSLELISIYSILGLQRKGGHWHGHITVRRSADPPDRGARFDQSHAGGVSAVGSIL